MTSAETGPSTISQISLVTSAIAAARFQDQRRVGGDAVEQAEIVEFADFLDVGCVDEEFHGRLLRIVRRALRGARPAFDLAESRGKVTRHERQFAPTGNGACRCSCPCLRSGPIPMRCPTGWKSAGRDRARAARAARGRRHRLGQRHRSHRSEEARPISRSSIARRSTQDTRRFVDWIRPTPVSARHGGAHAAARAGGVRSGTWTEGLQRSGACPTG